MMDVLAHHVFPLCVERPGDAFRLALVHRRVCISRLEFWLPFLNRRQRELFSQVEQLVSRSQLALLIGHYEVAPEPVLRSAGLSGLVWSKMPRTPSDPASRPYLYQYVRSDISGVVVTESGLTGPGRQRQVARESHMSAACFYRMGSDGAFTFFVGGSRLVPDEPIIGKVGVDSVFYQGCMIGECQHCDLGSLRRQGAGTLIDRNGVRLEASWGERMSHGRIMFVNDSPEEVVCLLGNEDYHWKESEGGPLLVLVDPKQHQPRYVLSKGAWRPTRVGELVHERGIWSFSDEFEEMDDGED